MPTLPVRESRRGPRVHEDKPWTAPVEVFKTVLDTIRRVHPTWRVVGPKVPPIHFPESGEVELEIYDDKNNHLGVKLEFKRSHRSKSRGTWFTTRQWRIRS
jgi:hypothetical protein